MILVRNVFQVKWNEMDKVLAVLKEAAANSQGQSAISRVLTDISGPNFTLIFESKADSLDAYWESLQAMFDSEQAEQAGAFAQYVESGYREFYNIEYEA